MVKKRVHELAKEFDIETKDLINRLNEIGVPVKNHMSTLQDDEVEKAVKILGPVNGDKKANEPNGKKKTNQQRGRGPGMDGNKETQLFRPDNSRGPGLVDRVPNRPPDRRFEEKTRQPRRNAQPNPPRAEQNRPEQAKPEQGIKEPRISEKKVVQHNAPAQGNSAGNSQGQRSGGPRGDRRPPYQGNRDGQGQRSSGAPRGDRPAYQGNRDGQGQRNQGPRNDHRPPYQGNRDGQGQRPSGPPRGDRPPYQGNRDGQRPFTPRGDRPAGSRPGGSAPRNNDVGSRIPKPPETARVDKPAKGPDKRPDKKKNFERDRQWANENTEHNKLKRIHNKKRGQDKNRQEQLPPPVIVEKKPIALSENLTVQELAEKMKKTAAEVIKKLMLMGVLATINQEIDFDTATLVASEFGLETELKVTVDPETVLMQEPEVDQSKMVTRPPVVTIMGHVDHGKTSLLDAIRQTNVTATEAGGITQHIGAYQVEHKGKKITFVDTPGHAAFTAMRARGAQVTDVAILVVAADDGVMPQTIEAINHAKAAEVPIIIAINKIDKVDANPDRVKQELTQHGVVVEAWGGETIDVEVSALKKEGLGELLEMILLVAEMQELKANPASPARGTVIEAELDKGRGPVATVLVQNGTLRIGDTMVAGTAFGRVRAMVDDKGRRVKKAGPSTPVEVLGLSDVPSAGDLFVAVEDEKLARQVVNKRQIRKREEELRATTKISLDDLFKHIQEGNIKELPIVIKADVHGSIEAITQSLEKLSTEEVKVNIIHSGVGAITETDIMLASASNAIVIGFNVRPDVNARKAAETEKVDLRMYRVIYDAIEDIKAAMSGLLEPEYKEVVLGRVEVRKVFKVSKVGSIAGCYVTDGKIVREAGVRVIRDGIVAHEGKLDSLKRFKDDVKEVAQGYECGLTIERFNDIQEGDIIEAYTIEAVKRELA